MLPQKKTKATKLRQREHRNDKYGKMDNSSHLTSLKSVRSIHTSLWKGIVWVPLASFPGKLGTVTGVGLSLE